MAESKQERSSLELLEDRALQLVAIVLDEDKEKQEGFVTPFAIVAVVCKIVERAVASLATAKLAPTGPEKAKVVCDLIADVVAAMLKRGLVSQELHDRVQMEAKDTKAILDIIASIFLVAELSPELQLAREAMKEMGSCCSCFPIWGGAKKR